MRHSPKSKYYYSVTTTSSSTAQHWEKLLYSAGGKLNFTKCNWYIVQWAWDENGIPSLMQQDELPAELFLTNGDDIVKTKIKRTATTDTLKTLGVLISPSGSNTNQYEKIEFFLTELIIRLKSKKLSELEAFILISVYIHTKLSYIFAGTTFTKEECDNLDKICRPYILSLMGINSKTKFTIIHASHKLGGMQIPTCWDLQGSLHLHVLIGSVQLGDMLGDHLITTIDYTYLHLGLAKPIFTYDFNNIKSYIPPSWITNT